MNQSQEIQQNEPTILSLQTIDIKNIQNFIDIISIAPTHTPCTFWDQIKFCTGDNKFYIYDFKSGVWKSVSGDSGLLPTSGEKAALAGTSAPADGNRYVNEDDAVLNSGDQTIADVKTFTSIPVLPASDPSSDNQAARKLYVDNHLAYVQVTASNNLKVSADTEQLFSNGSYGLLKSFRIFAAGTIRVKWQYKGSNAVWAVYTKLYVNGIARGSEHGYTGTTYQDVSEDITVVEGDSVELYGFVGSAGLVNLYVRNYRAYYDKTVTNNEYIVNNN